MFVAILCAVFIGIPLGTVIIGSFNVFFPIVKLLIMVCSIMVVSSFAYNGTKVLVYKK